MRERDRVEMRDEGEGEAEPDTETRVSSFSVPRGTSVWPRRRRSSCVCLRMR